ncbi:MAG: MFS transporter [Gammaproteobacteria bacterium]|nr:MFS transporter [Gammaproteobacteria bacterium]
MTACSKFFLVAMIGVSVISDSMLMPFYPQFFEAAFSVTDPQQTGLYLSAVCLAVMVSFPVWAAVSRQIPVLRLLIYTQCAAGLLSLLCYRADSLAYFWLMSLTMLLFKGSYLLIYPYIMSLEPKDKHGRTIGMLAVLVHLGGILGAAAGGVVLEGFEPRQAFLVMAAGDFVQMLVCVFLPSPTASEPETSKTPGGPEPAGVPSGIILRLGLIMLLFYFSVFLTRPFFASYWKSISSWDGEIVSGLVFAIPGAMALLALCLKSGTTAKNGIIPAILAGTTGLLLQASGQEALVLSGRCLFGWALFKATVRLDWLFFKSASSHSYAADFSKIYFFQSLGALVASYAAGSIVAEYGLQATFLAGAIGLAGTACLYALLFKARAKSTAAVLETL